MTKVTLEAVFPIGSVHWYLKPHTYHSIGEDKCPYEWSEWCRKQPQGHHQPYRWSVQERKCTSFQVNSTGISGYHFGPYGVYDSFLAGWSMEDIFFTQKEAEDEAFRRRYEVQRRME